MTDIEYNMLPIQFAVRQVSQFLLRLHWLVDYRIRSKPFPSFLKVALINCIKIKAHV